MRCRFRDDCGTVTAEFAIALPAVVVVLALSLGAIGLGGEQLRLQAAAFDAARLLGRGEAGATERIRSVAPDAIMSTHTAGSAICVDATAGAALGVLSGIRLQASACALDDAQP
jgi:Flp pilus assembly protein TadG